VGGSALASETPEAADVKFGMILLRRRTLD
jgi:hypothetical protein